MDRTAYSILTFLLASVILIACAPSQAELDGLATEVADSIFATQTVIAAEIFATQTAAVPTITPTFTSTPAPTFTPTFTSTPTSTPIPLGLYESDQFPFAIEYPADWVKLPEESGLTVSFGDVDSGTSIAIAEEDLYEIGLGETTLDEYTDVILFGVSGLEGFELISREEIVSKYGHKVMILEFRIGPGGVIRLSRLIYIHDNTLAFNATYIALRENHEDLRPLIQISFNSFDVTN